MLLLGAHAGPLLGTLLCFALEVIGDENDDLSQVKCLRRYQTIGWVILASALLGRLIASLLSGMLAYQLTICGCAGREGVIAPNHKLLGGLFVE